jgi:hypothetical protein
MRKPSQPRSPSSTRLGPLAAPTACLVVGIAFGYWIRTDSASRETTGADGFLVPASARADTMANTHAAQQRRRSVPTAQPLNTQRCPSDAESSEWRANQARSLLAGVTQRVAQHAQMLAHIGVDTPEAAVAGMDEYVSGWSQALHEGAPELVEELASEIERQVCDAQPSDVQTMLFSKLMVAVPESASAATMDCLFAKHTKEDAVLWGALDAFRASGLPRGQALSALEHTAKDERTKARLAGLSEPSANDSAPPAVMQPTREDGTLLRELFSRKTLNP